MIIVDTNVISEVISPRPTASVVNWLRVQPIDEVWTTAITAAELRAGVAALPEGRRKVGLGKTVELLLTGDFENRILAFDNEASKAFAEISGRRRRKGRNFGPLDMQIAAIAVVHGAAVATRNTAHFEEAGLILIDPWEH